MNGRVTAAILNMRSYPSLHGNVIATLSQNTLVEILGQHNEWLELKHGDLSYDIAVVSCLPGKG